MGQEEIVEMYGNRVRLRVCGLLVQDDRLLMVKHKGVTDGGELWAPPGGGLEFEETLEEGLRREFLEETGLDVAVGDFLFVYEFQSEALHAIELFFAVEWVSGTIKTGIDPELRSQIITEVTLCSMAELKALPVNSVHGLFRKCHSLKDVLELRGYLKN